MKPLHIILSVIGGAVAGAAVGLLLAPETYFARKASFALTATLMPSSTNLLKIFRQKCAINRNTSCYFRPGKLNISGRKYYIDCLKSYP